MPSSTISMREPRTPMTSFEKTGRWRNHGALVHCPYRSKGDSRMTDLVSGRVFTQNRRVLLSHPRSLV